MQSQNKKEKIAFLASLSLIYSYIEFLLPHPLPFLRFGFSNAIILSAFFLDFPSFLLLCVIKAVCSCFVSGTLFSPFFLISLAQSVASGIIMFGARKIKFISIYGISLLGSACSAVVQIFLCSFYLGKGTLNLLWIMLIFSIFSGLITAWLAQKIELPEKDFSLEENEIAEVKKKSQIETVCKITFILCFTAVIFITNKILLLVIFTAIAFVIQIFSRRRIFVLPHIFMWLFIFVSAIFIPSGKIIFQVWKITVTRGAIEMAVIKALKLSASMMLSQAAATIKIGGKSLIAKTMANYNRMISRIDKQKGKFSFARLVDIFTHASEL